MNIPVSVTPELVHIERHLASSRPTSDQIGPLGPSAGVREYGACVREGRHQFTLSIMIKPPGFIFGIINFVT